MTDLPFAEAAAWYDRFRPPYAPDALAYLAEAFALGVGAHVLDLGCGPGTLAIPLSRTGAEVVAVDPDAAMLSEGEGLAAARGAGSIRWLRGRAEDVTPGLGSFRMVVFGQSLHWMDRDRVLAMLPAVIEDGGGLAIVDEGQARAPESWMAAVAPVVVRHVGRQPRHPGKHPEVAHEPCLRRSGRFAAFTVREFPYAFRRDAASALGCLYAGVGISRAALGDRAAAFEAEIAAALAAASPSSVFDEQLTTAAFIAMKAAG